MTTSEFASLVRKYCLEMIYNAKASHIGSCFSCIDILAVAYNDILDIQATHLDNPNRDFFILSKGHASAALYATLMVKNIIPTEYLNSYCADSGKLPGHATSFPDSGVEISTGSLGHGLPVAAGLAYGAKIEGRKSQVLCLLSDGECQEGSNWETFFNIPRMKLNNLTVIVDSNKLQGYDRTAEIAKMDSFSQILNQMGWESCEIDGHNLVEIRESLQKKSKTRPTFILAHTIKGKGVSFMEDQMSWHYKSPNDEEYKKALKELS